MKDVYVIEALRTPFGSFGGALADIPAPKLGALVINRMLEKIGLPSGKVSEVILGHVLAGAQIRNKFRDCIAMPDNQYDLALVSLEYRLQDLLGVQRIVITDRQL